jgi:putative addiction module CopG family antidote
MNIALKKQFEEWIAAEVAAGRYSSETELVEEALQDLMDRAGAERLWQRLEESRRQIERGEFVVADDAFFDSLRERARRIAAQHSK